MIQWAANQRFNLRQPLGAEAAACALAFLWLVAILVPERAMALDAATNSLKLTLSCTLGEPCSPTNIPLRIAFENSGAGKVRLLAVFDPLPVFLSFDIVREDGTPLADLPGGGKVAFPPGLLRYVELAEGEFFGFRVDLAAFLARRLDEGRYRIFATYHNQYGENCYQGKVSSPWLELTVKKRP